MRSRLRAALAFSVALAGCSQAPARPFAVIGAPAPEIALTDQNGAPFRLSDRRGDVTAIFFGYTHCEDVCPTTLAHLHRAIETLPVTARRHATVAFVTVDPYRDDAASMKAYVGRFDPAYVALTGSFAELRPVYKAYRVFRNIVPRNYGKPYLVAHEGAIYIVDGGGTVRFVADWRDSPAELERDLAAAV